VNRVRQGSHRAPYAPARMGLTTARVVDTHTEGMPTRVVLSGVDRPGGTSVAEVAAAFAAAHDDLRGALVCEPRGHAAMYAAFVLPPLDPANHALVLYAEAAGFLPGCGHATIGVATTLVNEALIDVTEPETVVRVETQSGLVEARVAVAGGRATGVALRMVPSFVLRSGLELAGGPTVDVCWGGNFYAVAPAASVVPGLRVDPANARALIAAGMDVMARTDEAMDVVHPERPDVRGCKHAMLTDGDRSAVVIYTGVLDRSPCGTGTSARLALLHASGELAEGEWFEHRSVLGTRFQARIVGTTTVAGRPAVLPEIVGRAWITGRAELVVDPTDPFPHGFRL